MSESSVPETVWPLHNNSLTLLKGFAMDLKRATREWPKKITLTHRAQCLALNGCSFYASKGKLEDEGGHPWAL